MACDSYVKRIRNFHVHRQFLLVENVRICIRCKYKCNMKNKIIKDNVRQIDVNNIKKCNKCAT